MFDNGRQFDTKKVTNYYAKYWITTCFTVVAHPQSNSQAESANKIILTSLKKRCKGAKGLWVEELPCVLLGVGTMVKTSTGETLFMLIYGTDAVLPIEILEPILRVKQFDEDENTVAMRTAFRSAARNKGNDLSEIGDV